MGYEWLWLEDEEATVTDFREEVQKEVSLAMFNQIPALTRRLSSMRQLAGAGQRPSFGLILDIMIKGAPAFTRPQGWIDDCVESVFYTNHGYEAGLVYYEKMILGDEGTQQAFINPPPPVVFLTVMPTEAADIAERLSHIKERWARLRGTTIEAAKVRFVRKWDMDGRSLLGLLKEIGG